MCVRVYVQILWGENTQVSYIYIILYTFRSNLLYMLDEWATHTMRTHSTHTDARARLALGHVNYTESGRLVVVD